MAQLAPRLNWAIDLTSEELVVTLMALGNRPRTAEQMEISALLCDKLTKMRVDATRNALKQMDKLEDNLRDAR
jgi:hypothetical protein